MKHYRYDDTRNFEKHRAQEWSREHKAGGFKCAHCRRFVVINDMMGTANRNHCNVCLWSKHVDEAKGDRRSICHGGMGPVGLTLKHDGFGRTGEIMIIHRCLTCQKISINRIARDDLEESVTGVFRASFMMLPETKDRISRQGIYLLLEIDNEIVHTQLYGYRP
jgi:hypothetical protein